MQGQPLQHANPTGQVELTWFGTNSFLLRAQGAALLLDPFVELRGGSHQEDFSQLKDVHDVIISHGHFDHLSSMPQLLAAAQAEGRRMDIYCTQCGVKSLAHQGVDPVHVHEICPGDVFAIGENEQNQAIIEVFHGRHIKFDGPLVRETLRLSNMRRATYNHLLISRLLLEYPEAHQTVVYELLIGGMRVQALGSLSLQDNVEYPTGADVLILPYQGRSDLVADARRILHRLQPRWVVVSHFDDAFPPISQNVPTDGLLQMMRVEFPEVGVTLPQFAQPISLCRY